MTDKSEDNVVSIFGGAVEPGESSDLTNMEDLVQIQSAIEHMREFGSDGVIIIFPGGENLRCFMSDAIVRCSSASVGALEKVKIVILSENIDMEDDF